MTPVKGVRYRQGHGVALWTLIRVEAAWTGKPSARTLSSYLSLYAAAAASAKVRTANADQRVRDVLVSITKAQAEGVSSVWGIAAALNAKGITAPRGGEWSAAQVKRVLERR